MADISVDPWTWSSTAGSNNPTGATAVGTGLDDNLRAIQAGVKAALEPLSSVAGTNTVTATCTGLSAYASGQRFLFIPVNTNTGATTLNVTSLGAKNVFYKGVACGGGELPASIPVCVEYDGTQFNILSDGIKILATKQATTSGTSIDFTGIPAWAKKITVQFIGVSTNGTSALLVQLGDSGGIETTGYLGASTNLPDVGAIGTTTYTAGFGINSASPANVIHGALSLTLADSAAFTWVASGNFGYSNANTFVATAGSKSTSAALDRVRITNTGGVDTFDAGAINILYE